MSGADLDSSPWQQILEAPAEDAFDWRGDFPRVGSSAVGRYDQRKFGSSEIFIRMRASMIP